MRRAKALLLSLNVVLLMMICLTALAFDVNFPDKNLEMAIRETLDMFGRPLNDDDLMKLTELRASERDISDLTGMEYCSNLRLLWLMYNRISDIDVLEELTQLARLNLVGNQIADVSSLSGLLDLQQLYLAGNNISSISPLIDLTKLQELDLRSNPLNNDAYDKHIPRIQEQGTTVLFDPRGAPGGRGIITTIAGTGEAVYSGDGEEAILADLNSPFDVCVDPNGHIFIADRDNHRVRRIDAQTGYITTVAGTGEVGKSGDGGPATAARLNLPVGVALDSGNNLFIADIQNNSIRRVDSQTGIITTVVGTGEFGFSEDGTPAIKADLAWPGGVAIDLDGNLLVTDYNNHRIRRVDGRTGIITTVAGTGEEGYSGDGKLATEAALWYPQSICVDSYNNIFIADAMNNRIRRVDAKTGIITTVAGRGSQGYSGDGKLAIDAELNIPYDVFVDSEGDIFIGDYANNCVRRVDGQTGIITTAAGTGEVGFGGDGGPATEALLNNATGVAVDSAGNLIIADTFNHRVRHVEDIAAPTVVETGVYEPSEGFLSGTVTDSQTFAPIPGAEVVANDIFTQTDAAGKYQFTLESGNYTVTVSADGYFQQEKSAGVDTGSTTTLNFQLAPLSGILNGTVTDKDTGARISGADVEINGSVIQTDTSGMYQFTLSPDSYTVVVSADGYIPQEKTVNIAVGAPNTLNFQLVLRQGILNGTVTDKDTGARISGADVEINDSIIQTDTSGMYQFTLSPGSYTVTVSADGYIPQEKMVNIAVGAPNTLNFQLALLDGMLTGTVTDINTAAGIAGAEVAVNGVTTQTDNGGKYQFSLYPGKYTVTVSADKYVSQEESVTITAEGSVTLDFQLVPQKGILSGTVTDSETSAPIDEASVLVNGSSTQTDTLGAYEITLDAGTYTVTVSAKEYIQQEQKITITPGGSVTLDFQLVINKGTLAGTVTDRDTSAPVAGATVSVNGSSTQTDTAGSYQFTLNPGDYRVFVSAAGYTRREERVTITTGDTTNLNIALIAILVDNTPPEMVYSWPEYGEEDIDPAIINSSGIVIDFSEAVDTAQVSVSFRTGNQDLLWTPAWSDGDTKLTLMPITGYELGFGAECNLVLSQVTDQSGNAADEITLIFTTEAAVPVDDIPPEMVDSSPESGEENVNPDNINKTGIVITFSESIDIEEIQIIVETAGQALQWQPIWSDVNRKLTLMPETGNELDFGREYNLTLSQVMDRAGNTAEEITIIFTTEAAGPVDITGIITTVAGTGASGFSGDGGQATQASLRSPMSVFVDSNGDLFIADNQNNRVRRVDGQTGIITTVAGGGSGGLGDGGKATQAEISGPTGVLVDPEASLFIADYGNNRVRLVDGQTGIINTVAGGMNDELGDGGRATQAKLQWPARVFVDSGGDLFIADYGNNRVRRVDGQTGIITTVAGTGTKGFSGDGGPATQADLNWVYDVFVDSGGNIFIADTGNNRIRRIDGRTGIITTVAGTGEGGFSGDRGQATQARLDSPYGVFVDSSGDIFIADHDNNRVRRVNGQSGIITTAAGGGSGGLGDGGFATEAKLNIPSGVFVDSEGNLFIADYGNNRIRRVEGIAAPTTLDVGIFSPPEEEQKGTLNGTVTDSDSSAPIAGATIIVNGRSTQTDTLGTYELELDPGTYTITVSAVGYIQQQRSLTITAGDTTTLNFQLAPQKGTLAGTVTGRDTSSPIAGAEVDVDGTTIHTDTSGSYQFTLDSGSHNVTVSADGYIQQQRSVTITAGDTTTLNFQLVPMDGILSGTVTDSDTSAPIAGAEVSANGSSVQTDTSGSYQISLSPGSYTVTVEADGYVQQQKSANITRDSRITLDFQLAPAEGVFTGTITHAVTGAPVPGATVEVEGAGNVVFQDETDSLGRFSFSLPPGEYEVTTTANDCIIEVQQVEIEPGETENLSMTALAAVTVWPGDTRNDGRVSIIDILPIGQFWDKSGDKRQPQTADWQAGLTPIASWNPQEAAFADADGSGVVDKDDVLVIAENWGKTHTNGNLAPEPPDAMQLLADRSMLERYQEMYQALSQIGDSEGAVVLRDALGKLIAELRPKNSILLPNYPNPFNPDTWMPFVLAVESDVRIRIYDVSGRLVRELPLGRLAAGYYIERGKAAHWDGRNETGEFVASGVYVYQLTVNGRRLVRKMVVMR